jgi:serine/threonine-protein kinase
MDYERAIADHIEALRRNPRQPAACNAFAWLWATCPDPQLRNGRMGVELATRACELSAWEDWSCLLTLAAAQATLGDFDAAVRRARDALARAPAENQAECRTALRRYAERRAPFEA